MTSAGSRSKHKKSAAVATLKRLQNVYGKYGTDFFHHIIANCYLSTLFVFVLCIFVVCTKTFPVICVIPHLA